MSVWFASFWLQNASLASCFRQQIATIHSPFAPLQEPLAVLHRRNSALQEHPSPLIFHSAALQELLSRCAPRAPAPNHNLIFIESVVLPPVVRRYLEDNLRAHLLVHRYTYKCDRIYNQISSYSKVKLPPLQRFVTGVAIIF